MRKWGTSRTGSVSHTGRKKISKLGNEKMGCELEEWGCASEIKQNLNKIKAAPCEMQEKRQAVVARRAVMEFSDDSDLSDISKTRLKALLGRAKGIERYRRSSEESWEEFWWKKAMRRVGLAYRELIGSLYESWTIGIERVCKKLINSIIQRCKKWWKRGFETKERGRGTRP